MEYYPRRELDPEIALTPTDNEATYLAKLREKYPDPLRSSYLEALICLTKANQYANLGDLIQMGMDNHPYVQTYYRSDQNQPRDHEGKQISREIYEMIKPIIEKAELKLEQEFNTLSPTKQPETQSFVEKITGKIKPKKKPFTIIEIEEEERIRLEAITNASEALERITKYLKGFINPEEIDIDVEICINSGGILGFNVEDIFNLYEVYQRDLCGDCAETTYLQ